MKIEENYILYPSVEPMVYALQKLTVSCVIRPTSQIQYAESPDRTLRGAGIQSGFWGWTRAALAQLAHTCASIAWFAFFLKGTTMTLSHQSQLFQNMDVHGLVLTDKGSKHSPKQRERANIPGRGSLEKAKVPPNPWDRKYCLSIRVSAGINCKPSLKINPFIWDAPAVSNFQALPSDFYEPDPCQGSIWGHTMTFPCWNLVRNSPQQGANLGLKWGLFQGIF